MAKLKEELWKTFEELKDEQFDTFKWFLNQEGILPGSSGIPAARLEKAKRPDAVDLMIQKYQDSGALKVTRNILERIDRRDLLQRLQDIQLGPKVLDGARKEEYKKNKPKLEWVQQFAVDITLDPNTAHPDLILSGNGKQVRHGNVRKKLPNNPERFNRCVNVLGKQSFTSGRFYFEVQVKGKTNWDLGVAQESINRKIQIAATPENGYWILMMRNGEYGTIDDEPVLLSLDHEPQKVGVFVDYNEGLVSFYDVDTTDLLYCFTGCFFAEKLYAFLSPCTNDGGTNFAPLIISPVHEPRDLKTQDSGDQKQEHERKKNELKSLQEFAVDVTLDPDTANPSLILSDDGKRVRHADVRKKLPNNPERFATCVSVLGKQSFSSGKFYFEVQVKRKTNWDLGVAQESINRKGHITIGPENGFWTLMLRNEDEYDANDYTPVRLTLNHNPQKVGVFVDYENCLVSFYDVDTADLLYSFTGCSFTEKLYPYFSPCTNDRGTNSSPLIISPVNQPPDLETQDSDDQKQEHERNKNELKSLQEFAVDVTLDPDTANPSLILSDDGKRVRHADVRKKLPDNPERFDKCVSVLGKQSFSSGQFYFEVQVKGKTNWHVGVAEKWVNRKGDIVTTPMNGFWTIMLRNEDEYEANDYNPVLLCLNHSPQKVGVFVDYDDCLVSFYDVDTADLLYSFTGCSFTEKLYPFFSPCTNDGGANSAPLIISPVNEPLNQKTQDCGGQKKAAELKSVQKFAVDITLDPDTAHPHLILSDDGKLVHHGDVRKKLPDNPKRFNRCVYILGKQRFSSGRFYYEVQVKGKTAWTVGVAKESIRRKGDVTLGPKYGFWTICLENEDNYQAVDDPLVHPSIKSNPQKLGVFVDYDEGLVSFYDADTADLLHSFTDCPFTEKLYPFFSPGTNDGGTNSAPLIISPVNEPLNLKTQDCGGQKKGQEGKKPELRSVEELAVELNVDPDTPHSNRILSDDGKQVHDDDVREKLPKNFVTTVAVFCCKCCFFPSEREHT